MSRAAFLPTPGDPFLIKLWLSFYPRWQDEIDHLYVYVNSDSPAEVIDYIKDLIDAAPKTTMLFKNHQIEHGQALYEMVHQATEDYIMFVEDDAFIFKPGKVDECFKVIESGQVDMIGSKRGSCSKWLYDTASSKWNIDNSGYGDHGPNFWPNFFFAKRADLLKVTNFAARYWEPGEMVDPLGLEAPEALAGDTFVEGSLQLRALGLRAGYVEQFHGNTDDKPDYDAKAGIWGSTCAWTHVGSLSSGFHGMLKADHKLDAAHFRTDQEKLELERRIVFYKLALREAEKDNELAAVKDDYQEGIIRLITIYELSPSRIEQRIRMYQEAMQ